MQLTVPNEVSQKIDGAYLKPGREVARKLQSAMAEWNKEHSENTINVLTAPQIGINQQVMVVQHNHRLYTFINPRYTDMSAETFPNQEDGAIVNRHFYVTLCSDDAAVPMLFGLPSKPPKKANLTALMKETADIQRGMDSLYGLTPADGLETRLKTLPWYKDAKVSPTLFGEEALCRQQ